MFKQKIGELLSKQLNLKEEDVLKMLERPQKPEFGDYAFPCFGLAMKAKENPFKYASKIVDQLNEKLPKEIEKTEVKGAYINFFLNKKVLAENVLKKIMDQKSSYGGSSEGKGKTIVIDYSSPNIAKPMSIGHLRSTIIGNSLLNIFSILGYKTVGINYLGDYGTQFGKLLVAYKKWGKQYNLDKDPIKTLLELYQKFHAEVEAHPELEDDARMEFKKIEEGNKENLELWKKFRELSVKDFKRIYAMMNVKFDVWSGESLYIKKAKALANSLKKKKIAVESAESFIVSLEDFNMPPCLITKSDGTTLYATRDLAASIDRNKKYKFDQMIYVTGSEQKLHFQQIFKVLEIIGEKFWDKCHHVYSGMIYSKSGKISSRKSGKELVFMEDVINEAISESHKFISTEMKDKEKDKIAQQVGVSAIIYADLSNDKIKDVEFDWDKILRLEGNSGPYLQYSYRRASSILEKEKFSGKFSIKEMNDEEKMIVNKLSQFPEAVENAAIHYAPHIIANYANELAQLFNNFYEKCQVLKAEKVVKGQRLAIVSAVKQVLANSLKLLGMQAPDKM